MRRIPRELGYRAVQILAYVEETRAAEGQAPSYGMISNKLGMTKGAVCRSVQRLERRALLSRVGSGRVRRIQLPVG
jgi:DNA-binding IclR family transcriptional regulator